MSAIDKSYGNANQFKEAVDWAKSVGVVTLKNGYKFKPLNSIRAYNDIDNPNFNWNEDEYILWNNPYWFDKWLWFNCPLTFVKDIIIEQYGNDEISTWTDAIFDNPKDKLDFGKQKYTFLKEPKWRFHKWLMGHGRRDWRWPNNCQQATYHPRRHRIVQPSSGTSSPSDEQCLQSAGTRRSCL